MTADEEDDNANIAQCTGEVLTGDLEHSFIGMACGIGEATMNVGTEGASLSCRCSVVVKKSLGLSS